MLLNATNLNALFTGYKTLFDQGFAGAPSNLNEVAMTVPSSSREENYGWLGTFPGMREWVGPRIIKNLAAQSYAIKNKPFESTISIDRDDIEDDQVGIYRPMFAELGRNAKMHPDLLIFELMKNAFAVTCYDGQSFFDTDHPVRAPGTDEVASVSNMQAGGGAPWFLLDTSRAIKPFIFQTRKPYELVRKDQASDDNVFFEKEYIYGVDSRANVGVGLWQLAFGSKAALTPANYAAARAAMMSFKDDEGRPLGIQPGLLVCGPSLEESALGVLNADRSAGDISNVWKGTAKLIVTPYLA